VREFSEETPSAFKNLGVKGSFGLRGTERSAKSFERMGLATHVKGIETDKPGPGLPLWAMGSQER